MQLAHKKKSAPTESEERERTPRDLRYRRQLFPDADNLVFDVGEKGFVPVPIILRKLLRYLTPPEVRVLLYLHLRASRYGICYPTTEEMVHELGLTTKKNLVPHIKNLEDKQFIATRNSGGKTFYLIYDPRVAIKQLIKTGELSETALFEINDLYADLNQESVDVGQAKPQSSTPEPETPEETEGTG